MEIIDVRGNKGINNKCIEKHSYYWRKSRYNHLCIQEFENQYKNDLKNLSIIKNINNSSAIKKKF